MPLDDMKWSPATGADETTALLIRARSFLEHGWCRYMWAMDADGHPVDPTTTDAVAWCAEGALNAAGMSEAMTDHPALNRLRAAMGVHITLFNDVQESLAPVLMAFDRAIAGGQL